MTAPAITLPRYGWLTASAAAELVGVSTRTLAEMRERGEVPRWALLPCGTTHRYSAVWCAGFGAQPVAAGGAR